MNGKILIIGGLGQVGMELCDELRKREGAENVILSDIHGTPELLKGGPFVTLDVLEDEHLRQVISENNIKIIYHLAAILSASGEKKPKLAWKLNVEGLLNVLQAAVDFKVEKVFWPSSIAVFGPDTPKQNTPQETTMNPNTVYGISKLAGEKWCAYYHEKFGLDVRSLRYPGLIGYKALPGGGTTDYAVEIFHEAIKNKKYTCFLKPDSVMPMLYMPDAIRATLEIMAADKNKINVRTSYNLGGMSFSPKDIAVEIEKIIPGFSISYAPDSRQSIADSWPQSIDDSVASDDWNWKPNYALKEMSEEMIQQISLKYSGVSV